MKRGFTCVVAITVMALALASRAHAGPIQISLTNGASSVLITDGGVGDACVSVNCVTFLGVVGNYLINISTGVAQDGVNPFLDLNSVNLATQPNAGLLTIATSQTGFMTDAPGFGLTVGGTSTLGGNSTFKAYGGNSNIAFDTSHLLGALAFPTSPFSGSVSGSGNLLTPYSLTIVATVNGITTGTASFDAALGTTAVAVPEPATMSLLGAALIALRRKMRRPTTRVSAGRE